MRAAIDYHNGRQCMDWLLLSADIQKFCSVVQKRLLDEIVDRDVEKGKE